MGVPEKFEGCNSVLICPADRDDVQDLHTFRNGVYCVSKWRLSAEELEEVARTGCVFLSVMSGKTQPPVFVGGEDNTRQLISDTGAWKR